MAKQPRGRHGTRRARKVTLDATSEMRREISQAYEQKLQCLFDYFIDPQDIRRLAQNPPPRRRLN
jgi:hypothetical protein